MTTPGITTALTRFGLGARPDETPSGDPRRWLLDQLDRYTAAPARIAAVPTSGAVAARLTEFYDQRRDLREQYGPRRQQQPAAPAPVPPPMSPGTTAAPPADPYRDARQAAARDLRQGHAAALAVRTGIALTTTTPFVERLVHFWANHFAVSADKLEMVGLAHTLEFEAIRPHVLGRFADMLLAVERHPAMLVYLDQAVSVGPNSPVGQRGGRRAGLNENLARETLELHTLGVRTGYTQGDVIELARALTGWTVAGLARGPAQRAAGDAAPGSFVFAPALHEPGDRTITGTRYPAAGEAQATKVLADLAASPATARHLATKLARHFAGDVPPPAMIARLEQAYRSSNGDLPTMYRAIIASPEAWVPTPVKFRTPWEWSVATFRAVGTREVQPGAIVGLLNQLGQPAWKPGQPIGYDDVAASWAGPDAIMRRVEAAERMAGRTPATDARALGAKLFPDGLSAATTQAIARAESPAQGLALLLVSPEMMRR
ncbi:MULTISPECIES: DUF1800 domain-containing protein [unclassified Sphingomonas]|uniref:DUF1800 domain-containing protein n=1 Tax=unclassified Sphingomonas TaxID=196159 RepID=UPI000AD4895A|nr:MULTISPECIES: DUF1800 domain-containing protein [unclassified Sphingomonas]